MSGVGQKPEKVIKPDSKVKKNIRQVSADILVRLSIRTRLRLDHLRSERYRRADEHLSRQESYGR